MKTKSKIKGRNKLTRKHMKKNVTPKKDTRRKNISRSQKLKTSHFGGGTGAENSNSNGYVTAEDGEDEYENNNDGFSTPDMILSEIRGIKMQKIKLLQTILSQVNINEAHYNEAEAIKLDKIKITRFENMIRSDKTNDLETKNLKRGNLKQIINAFNTKKGYILGQINEKINPIQPEANANDTRNNKRGSKPKPGTRKKRNEPNNKKNYGLGVIMTRINLYKKSLTNASKTGSQGQNEGHEGLFEIMNDLRKKVNKIPADDIPNVKEDIVEGHARLIELVQSRIVKPINKEISSLIDDIEEYFGNIDLYENNVVNNHQSRLKSFQKNYSMLNTEITNVRNSFMTLELPNNENVTKHLGFKVARLNKKIDNLNYVDDIIVQFKKIQQIREGLDNNVLQEDTINQLKSINLQDEHRKIKDLEGLVKKFDKFKEGTINKFNPR